MKNNKMTYLIKDMRYRGADSVKYHQTTGAILNNRNVVICWHSVCKENSGKYRRLDVNTSRYLVSKDMLQANGYTEVPKEQYFELFKHHFDQITECFSDK